MTERSAAARLYAWSEGRRMRAVTASDVNDDIRARTGGDFTAKDFRTLRGTIAAADALAQLGVESTARARTRAIRDAIEHASSVLGNTPTIAKASYVDPRVIARYEHGRTITLRGTRERALLELLGTEEITDG
jgi:DNA topoisomerase-1